MNGHEERNIRSPPGDIMRSGLAAAAFGERTREQGRMLDRGQLEEREEQDLGPWALKSSRSSGRRHPDHDDPHRPAYARDRDRVVHSGAFRRLEYKTQVLINDRGDNFRTRLTHTLEVAQIARSCARALRLNESLVEALALAHDLGHPPFGHTGEEALRDLMHRLARREGTELGGFEHNVQALRVVDLLECPYPGVTGLNLTRETRESILKHGVDKAGALADDLREAPQPWLEAQLVDLADSLAYLSHDLEDGLRSRVFTARELHELELWRRAHDAAASRYPSAAQRELLRPTIHQTLTLPVHDLIGESSRRIDESAIREPAEAREQSERLVSFSTEMAGMQRELKRFLFRRFYRAEAVIQDRHQASHKLEELFLHLYEHPEHMRAETSEPGLPAIEPRDDEPLARTVCDYVAGMTDRFALNEHARLVEGLT